MDTTISPEKGRGDQHALDMTAAGTEDESTTTYPACLTMDEAVDRLGYGRFQRRLLVAAGLCSASDAMEILLLSFLSVVVPMDWDLPPQVGAHIFSVFFVGAFCGTLLLGRLGDTWGRRPTFILTAGIVATFGLLTCLCQTLSQLLVVRFFVGVGIGGVTIPFDTYGEFLPTNCRGTGLVYPSYFWTTGTVLVAMAAQWTLGHDAHQWRWLCLVSSMPCLVATLVGYHVVPESPRWLLSHQYDDVRALSILRHAAVANGHDPNDLFPPDTVLITTSPAGSEGVAHNQGSLSRSPSMSPQWIRTFSALLFVWFGYAFVYYGTILAVTAVFTGDSNESDRGTKDTTFQLHLNYPAIVLASSAEFVGTTLLALTIDRWGRRFLHSLSFVLGGFAVGSLCWMAATTNDSTSSSFPILLSLAFFSRGLIFCGSAVTWIWTTEVLSTDFRSTGHSLANAGARLGGFFAPYVVAHRDWRTIGLLLIFWSMAVAVVAHINLPETKGTPMESGAIGLARIEEEGTLESVERLRIENGSPYSITSSAEYQHVPRAIS